MVTPKRRRRDQKDGSSSSNNNDDGQNNNDGANDEAKRTEEHSSSDFEPISLEHIANPGHYDLTQSHHHPDDDVGLDGAQSRCSPTPSLSSSPSNYKKARAGGGGGGSEGSGGHGGRSGGSKKAKLNHNDGSTAPPTTTTTTTTKQNSNSTGATSSSGQNHINNKANSSNNNNGKSSPMASSTSNSPSSTPAKPHVVGKGLRHFSMKVCEKVEAAGTTSYNEVADELVRELKEAEDAAYAAAQAAGEKSIKPKKTYDEKNIRRRVYDALNVLMAMDIISKDKKLITWRGLPGRRRRHGHEDSNNNNSDEDYSGGSGDDLEDYGNNENFSSLGGGGEKMNRRQRMQVLQEERAKREESIKRKRDCLQELIVQNVGYRNLIGRNHSREVNHYRDDEEHLPYLQQDDDGNVKEMEDEKIPLPFLVVSTHSKAVIQCEMCPDNTNVNFDFTLPFEINDDNEILKRLGMNFTSKAALQRTLPPDLFSYCNNHGLFQAVIRAKS